MQSIHDVIMRKRRFVGRKKELLAMERLLTAKKEEWHILHFYGSAGMGKTVLLQQFVLLHEEDFPIIYIDGHGGFQSEQDFLDAIFNQLVKKQMLTTESTNINDIEKLKSVAQKYNVLVLILDGLDQSQEMLDWFKNKFIKLLPTNIRVYSAGRRPFDHWQIDYGFENIVRNVHMKPFNKVELAQYAALYGITDAHLLYQIGFISQGIPLAIALICNRILEHGNFDRLSKEDYRSLIELFDKHLLSEENLNGVNSSLLALASLTYIFDQELLEYMRGEPVSEKEFFQLCQSPFIETHANGGWMVKNGMRWWIRAGFKDRFPDTYKKSRQRGDKILEHRLLNTNHEQFSRKLELALGRFFLKETEFTRSLIYFGGQKKLKSRAAKEEELPLLAEMYQKNIQISPPFLKDDTHQEQYLYEIWKIDPSFIQIIEHNNKCEFFYVLVPLNKEVLSIFKINPVTKSWASTIQSEEKEWFYWILSTNPPTDWEIVSFFFEYSFFATLEGRRVTCLLVLEDQAELLKLVGFEHLSFADFRTASGLQFTFYRLDSRKGSSKTGIASGSFLIMEKEEIENWVKLTKEILSRFTVIDHQLPLLEKYKQLLKSDLEYDELSKFIKKVVEQQHQQLKEGTKQEKTQAKILKYAYINKNGSHESVAHFLDIPTSTYYRQLKKLVHDIAFILQSQTK